MKSFISTVLFLALLFGVSQECQAQDVITKKSGKKVTVWIKEMSDTKIKYVEVGDPNEIIFSIDRALVKSVEFSYGKKVEETNGKYSEDYFFEDKSTILKLNFFALRLNALIISYEKALTPTSSFESSLKFLGINFFPDNGNLGQGFAIDAAYKLKMKSLFKKDGEFRPQHLLEGGYFAPKIGFNYINEDFFFGGQVGTRKARLINLGIDLGKQWIFSEILSLDVFIGFHYYGGPVKDHYPSGQSDDANYYNFNAGDLGGGDNTAVSFGIRVGYLFGQFGKTIDDKKRKRR